TPLGALPKKVMVELYDKRFLLDHHIESGLTKLWKENDCISIRSMRLIAELAGLVKKTHGKLTLTKKSEKLLDTNDRSQLFRLFFRLSPINITGVTMMVTLSSLSVSW